MIRKRLLTISTLIIVIACLFCLVACGDDDPSSNTPPKQEPFTVTFETNGGTAIDPVNCTSSDSFKNILGDKTTKKDGKKFNGWYTDSDLRYEAEPNVVISADKTFYAGWRDYTDAEVLENAVLYAYENAIAITDVGYVRTGKSTSNVNTVNAAFTMENGKITSGYNSTRYFSDGALYGVLSDDKTKLIPDNADDVIAYLYHNDVFRTVGFYSAFAPLAMAFAAEDSKCVFNRTNDDFQIKYLLSDSAVQFSYVKYGNPWIYFDCGKTFDYKISDGKLVEVKQSGSKTRTIQFFYDGDTLPEILEPEDKTEYTQKWQVKIAIDGGGTQLKYYDKLNKDILDKDCFTDDYKPQTSKLTYYLDKEKTQPITFDQQGNAMLEKHTTIYHKGIDYKNATVASYDIDKSSAFILLREDISEDGIKTTTLLVDITKSLSLTLRPRPYNAKDFAPKVTFASTPTDDPALYDNAITVSCSEYSADINIQFPVSGEYTLKVESNDGFVCQYIKIRPKS